MRACKGLVKLGSSMWERPTLTVDLTILWAGEEKDGGAGFLSLLPDC